MHLLTSGMGILFAAILVQLIMWKTLNPRRHTKALCEIFAAVTVLWLSLAGYGCAVGWPIGWLSPHGLAEYMQLMFFVGSTSVMYILSYSGIEADSPSLVMVLTIADAGDEGLPEDSFFEKLNDDVLVRPRVNDLFRDGHIVEDGGRLKITAKGRGLISIVGFYRKALGVEMRGG